MFSRRKQNLNILSLKADEAVIELEDLPAVDFFASSQVNLSIEDKVKHYFEQLREPVFRYLISTFSDNQSQAEEITQEAFIDLYRAMKNGQTINNVRAWIFHVARCKAINVYKSNQFLAPLSDEEWLALQQTVEDKGLNPEQILLQKEKLDCLRKAISRLTFIERECLNLRTKGFRYREIGEILEIGTTTVSDTLNRVIEKLAKETNG